MADKFDQEDPFKKYGGNQMDQEDPFKKYGGVSIEEPSKKKIGSGIGGKVGSSVGRLDVGAGITEIDDKGKPVGGALSRVSGITTPEQAKISRVNKAFGKIESFAGSREDFEEIYKQAPQEFDNLAKQVAPNVNKGEIDKFYTTEAARKDAYVDRVLQSYNQQKTKAQLESARRYRPVIESQFSTATIPLSNYTGKQYQLPQSEAQVSEILSDLNNEKEKLKTELTTNWNLSEVQTKAKELSEIEAAIRQNLTYQVGRMALERLSQNSPNVTSKDIGKEIFRVLHPDEYDLYEKVGGDKPVSFTVGTQRDTPVEADALNEQMVKLGNEIKRMYGNETAIQDADIEEQTAKRKYTFQRQAQVKQKIAAILHERGLSPDKATEELKDKVVNKYLPDEDKEIWYNNNKVYNNVDLPSTGFAYSLKNAYYDTVKDAVGTVFGGLMPNRKKMRAAELLEGMSTSDVLGEDPQFKARLSQLKDKEKTQQLNDQEKQEKEQLEQFTDLRSKKQKIFDMAGSGIGQILGLGSISAFTGGLSSARTGLGALKSLVAPSGGRGGIMAASYLMSHENNAKEALRMFPNEKDALKRFFSTEFNTAIDMAVEQIFPEEQFLSGIAKKEVSKLITNLTAKNIASTLNDNAFKQLAKNIVGRSKKLLATPLQETAEEEIALSLKKTFEGIIAPDKSEGLTLKDVVETGEQAFWGSVLLGAPKGVFGYTNNKVPLTALWDAASSQDGYTKTKMTIERLKRDGELTEAEAKDRLDNLELGRNEYINNPILSGDMGGLDAGQKQNYFARILNEAILKKKADVVTDPNLKKQYEQQIKESEAIREKIYKGEIKVTPENEEITKREFEKREKEQQGKTTIGLQDKIDDIERRRQEELKNIAEPREAIKVETYEAENINTGEKQLVQIRTTKDGKKEIFVQGEGIQEGKLVWKSLGDKYSEQVSNETLLGFVENPKLIKTQNEQEFLEEKKATFKGKTVREKINAKYDAELAALEQPTIDQDRVLGDEETVVSQSDEELLTTLQELAQEGVKDQDLQFFVDQAANAPNQFIETYGEQVTQELLDKATTEQIQKGLEDAKKFENNPNVSLLEKELERRGETITDFVAPQEEAGSGGVVVGEEIRGYKFPDENEIYDIIENEEGRHGGEFIGDDGKFQTEDDARRYVKEVSDHLGGIAAQENIPIYRVVQADEVDLTPYGIGESWTFDLDAAKEFAKMNLSGSPKDWKIISAIVPKENVDWEQAVRQYTNFSDIMSAESEFELPIEPNSKLLNVSVSDYKKAKPIEQPKAETPTQAKELADKGVGKYEKKAREIAEKIQKSELPGWLKADLPDGTKKAGASYDQLKKALADAVIEMGRLLDKGVEYSQAIKQAVKDLVSLQGEENRDTIEKGFEKYYTDQTQQEPPPPQTPKQEPKEVGGDMGGKKKAVLNRLYNAKNVPQSAKEGFEREGLTYKPKSQKEAAEIAKSILDEFGVDEAVELADSSSMFEGDVRTLIFAEALDRLQGEENAARWAEVAIAMDKFERSSGRAASAVNYFYKNNPYGVQLKEEADRKEAFDKWATSKKEKSWKEFFEEFKKDPEFNQYFKEQVYEELKKERAKSRQGRIKKVRDVFAKAKASVGGKGAVYSAIIPPKIITGALDVMEKLYEAGEAVAEVIQRGIDYINKEYGTSWDSEKFREEWEEKLKEPSKAPLTEEEFKKKVLDRFRNRLKGLSDKQRDEVVRRMFDKVVNAGALEYDDLRDIIADVLGYGKLTAEEGKRLQELVKKRNAVGEAAKKAQEERTDKALEEYRLSEIEAGKAARELQELLWNKPDIIKRLTSIMQLSTLGIPSLINNPVYNFFNQLGVRFPVGLINSTIDKVGQFVANKMGKNYVREYNIFDGQAEFWAKLGVGSKEAVQQLFTGLNRQDYIQKEYYGQQIRPMRAIRDLIRWKAGEKKLTKAQVIDKALQASVGIPAEVVARFLNIGDKPQRFAAEGSQAAAFAKALGLKDIDRKLFIEFPKEEAYRAYKAQGLSDEAAATKSEYIKEAIIKEGQRSTFQQDNLLNDAITRFFGAFGGKDSGTANLVKTLSVSPYIKIPTNAFWSYYNLVNPEVAILQSFYHAGRAKMSSNKGDEVAAKLQMREARYWLAHALTGMAMRGLVVFLVQAGIFVAGNTGDESKKEREAESFFEQPGTLNISKLWALMRGEDPKKVKNGVLVSNRWFGQFGTLGNSIMRKWEDMTPEQRENQQQFWNIAFGGMELEALKEMENGIFANTSSLLDVINTEDFSRYGLNTINMFTNILQPASIAQFNRASLNEVPQAKGDTFLEKLNQNFAQRSSLYRKAFDVQLQKKRSIWGEPIPKGGNILSRMFGIFKIDEKKEGRPMYEDYLRTNDSGFLPPAVLPTMGKQKLNQEQYNKLQDYIGQSRKAIALPYIDDKAIIPIIGKKYSELNDKDGKPNDELRKAVLQYLYELGRDNGVAKFYQDYPEFKKPEKSVEEQVQESLLQSALELIKLQNR